jgi:hypothetical protein
MGGWRSKLIFLLIIYFAGFATAIYCLAPVPEDQNTQPGDKSFVYSAFKSDEFAESFNTRMHKFIDIGKDVALRVSKLVKRKIDEMQTQS